MFTRECREHCAIFYRDLINGRLRRSYREGWLPEATVGSSGGEVEASVFVEVVEFLKEAQDFVARRVESITRLQVLDSCNGNLAHALPLPRGPFVLELRLVGADGKCNTGA